MINPPLSNQSKSKSQSQSQSQSQNQTQTKRRSLSVSAVSRKPTRPSPEPDIDLFSNKRDNPLYWTSGGPCSGSPTQQTPSQSSSSSSILTSSSSVNNSKFSKSTLAAPIERGRPVSRNADQQAASERGRPVSRNSNQLAPTSRPRSSSRVDIHAATRSRGRSVSRHTYIPSSEGEEVEQRQKSVSKPSWNSSKSTFDHASSLKRPISSTPLRNANPVTDNLHLPRRSSRSQSRPSFPRTSHPSPSADSSISNSEDYISTGSLSEAEEKTIRAVYEQIKSIQGNNLGGDTSTKGIYETVRSEVRRAISDIHHDLETAIRRSNVAAISSADVTDFPPDLVKSGAVELVSEIRREYAKKLGESQERAKKLREDLAVEEHRGLELTKILKETLPDPKTPTSCRSRKGRRASSERRRMSKRLTDEAISYFDECVSISTFDSSDFSAAEDSAIRSVGATQTSLPPQESPCISDSCGPESAPIPKQLIHGSSRDASIMANVSSSCNEGVVDQARLGSESTTREWSRQFQISSTVNNETIQQEGGTSNIYAAGNFEKKHTFIDNDENATVSRTISSGNCKYYDLEGAYDNESLLFDCILFNKRIQSGSLHLCGGSGGIPISFLPFASFI